MAERMGFEPMWLLAKRFSRPPRYDRFDTSPYLLEYIITRITQCQDFFKKRKPLKKRLQNTLLFFAHLCKAFAAIYRAIIFWLERNLTSSSATCTDCIVHFSWCFCCCFSCKTAFFASLRLVHKALFCIEFLLTKKKNKFISAVFTN